MRRRAPVAFHDDFFELIHIGQAAQTFNGELKDLARGDRRRAQLSGHDLNVLVGHRVQHILGGQVEVSEPLGVQPDPQAVGPGPENPDLTHPGQPGQGVLDIDNPVIGQEGRVEPVTFRVEAGHQQDIGGDLPDIHPLLPHHPRELGQGAVDLVLDQGQGGRQVGPDVEGDGQRIRPVAAAGGGQVNGMFHPVDRLLDRHADGGGHHAGAGPGIAGRNLDRRRGDRGILFLRELVIANQPDDDGHQGQHIGQDGPLDKESGDHDPAFGEGGGAEGRSGVT